MQKLHTMDKHLFCQNIYEHYIVTFSERLQKYEQYAEGIRRELPVSCYTNFRDALFHFRKMVYCTEEQEIEEQAFAIKEHLSRMLTDASNALSYTLSLIAEDMLTNHALGAEQTNALRTLLHKVKNAIILKRMDGMMLSIDEQKNLNHDDVNLLIDEFYAWIEENCPEKFAAYSRTI